MKSKHDQDPLFLEMDKNWRSISPQLIRQLEHIPQKHELAMKKSYGTIIIILNTVLAAWTLGMVFIFRTSLIMLAEKVVSFSFIDLGSFAVTMIGHPIFSVLLISGFGIFWLSYDLSDS